MARKTAVAAVATTVYLVALAVAYWLDITLLKVDVVFYSSLKVGAVVTVLAAACMFVLPVLRRFNAFEKLQLVLVWGLVAYILAISVPTLIDRSLSFYILEKLQQRGGGIRLDRFNEIFTQEYMREHRLVEVRLTEQQASGTLRIEDGCVRITERGRRLAAFGQYFRKNLLPRQRLLSGVYTDALTDPFKRSDPNPDYLCK